MVLFIRDDANEHVAVNVPELARRLFLICSLWTVVKTLWLKSAERSILKLTVGLRPLHSSSPSERLVFLLAGQSLHSVNEMNVLKSTE